MVSLKYVIWKAALAGTAGLSLVFGNDVPAPYEEAIADMVAVENEGRGNEAAAAAWKQVVQGDAGMVVPLLEAMEGASGLASNWLVSAAQAIVDRELAEGRSLPLDELGAYLMDTRQDPEGRRLAFEVIRQVDPGTAAKLVPGMLNDPSTAMRRDAVAGLLSEANTLVAEGKEQAATIIYRQALGARETWIRSRRRPRPCGIWARPLIFPGTLVFSWIGR